MGLKVQKSSFMVLYLALLLTLAVPTLAYFHLIDLSKYVSGSITILAGLFVLLELGWKSAIKKQAVMKDPLRFFGVIVAFIAIVAALIGFAGWSVGFLDAIQGIVNALVMVYVIVEAFR